MSAVAQSVDQGLPPLFPNGSPIANPQAESPIAIRHSDLDMTIIRGSRDSFGSIGINDNDSTFPSSAELQSDPILTNFGQPKFNDDHLAHDSPVANLDNNNGSIFNDNMNKLEHFAKTPDSTTIGEKYLTPTIRRYKQNTTADKSTIFSSAEEQPESSNIDIK